MSKGGLSSWRAHANALNEYAKAYNRAFFASIILTDTRVVSRNLTSALILEDDVDWDVRLKSQLRTFAEAVRALSQPVSRAVLSAYADPSYPTSNAVQGSLDPTLFYINDLPVTVAPTVSPYGDNWDVLHIGHCGMRSPAINVPHPWKGTASTLPRGHVVHLNDVTVPEPH